MALPRFPHAPGRIALTGRTRFFFDRAAVKNSLNAAELRALTKASLAVKDLARKSIKKKGRAKPLLKVQRQFPDKTLSEIERLTTTIGSDREGRMVTKYNRSLLNRMREIQTPEPSPPGTPPFTHTPNEGHQASYLGFRRNLWNFFDPATRSAVVGPSAKGRNLPFLHEFGGTVNIQTMVWIPRLSRSMRRPIIRDVAEYGGTPRSRSRWRPVGAGVTVRYPPRPFMRPALRKAIMSGRIARAFKDCFGGGRVQAAGVMASG